MDPKSILLAVADQEPLAEITQALGAGWDTTSVASESDALAQFEKRSFDALLVDFNLGWPDASELLNQALEKRPETIRFLLAYEADLALVAAKVLGSPHILPKPIESASLKSRIEKGVADWNFEEPTSEPAEPASESPTVPAVYSEVLKALESPDVTNAQVGEIIAQDAELTSEVLRLTNSSYLGLPRNITDPVEALESLGSEAVKALVMARQFLAENRRLRPGYLSLDQVWEHSFNVGQIARDLVLFETKDRKLASQALAAGLLHDLGKVVLVTNFDDLYGRVHSLARKQPVTLWDVEKEMFGANHGEIGACLVGMWNMPGAIVEATAFHHEPPLGESQQLTPLAAVHIANVLEHELHPGEEGMMVTPVISSAFLNELGLLQRLPVWRAAFANRRLPQVQSAETNQSESTQIASTPGLRTANNLPGPVTATQTTTSGQASSAEATPTVQAARYRSRWVYGAVVAGVLVLLGFWSRTQSELKGAKPVYARTSAAAAAPVVVLATPAPDQAPAAAPSATQTLAGSEEPPAAPTPSEPVAAPVASVPAPEPTTATVPPTTSTNVPAPPAASQEKAPPEFRVNAIIYASVHPSAIVNGRTVGVGEQVNDATVVAIGRTAVTLEINGQRKTYELR